MTPATWPRLAPVTRRAGSGAGPRRARAAAAVLSGCGYALAAAASRGVPGRPERRLFQAVNSPRDHVLLRGPQQLGTPWVLPGIAVTAAVLGRPRLAVAAALALPVEKACEVGTKELVGRPRPGRVLAADLHDDAPVEGPSYPSGHAALATCAVGLVAPHLPVAVVAPLGVTAAVTTVTRVHQGAHFPLDAIGGVLLGVAVAVLTTCIADVVAVLLPI